MTLVDVLLTEHLLDTFQSAAQKRADLNAVLVPGATVPVDVPLGDRGVAARIEKTSGEVLVVSSRGVWRLVGDFASPLLDFAEIVGYDWIAPEMEDKIAEQREHYDRLIVYLADERSVTVSSLGPAVYPLMDFLGKVLEVRSQKIIRRGLDDDVVALLGRCLRAAVEGPFFADGEMDQLFAQDRGSLAVVASMWTRMNLAAPDLRRTVESVTEMLLERGPANQEAWDEWVDADPVKVRAALAVFSRVVSGDV